MKRWLVFALLGVAAHAGAQRSFEHNILAETFGFDESTKKTVALEDLKQGCPARDCIPSIDEPKFVSADAADHVADDAVVIAISYGGEHRAYPAQILDHHEIVNDTIAGEPIAITWCPLCGSAVGVRRTVGGDVTEFGVSGVLYNSDLVLYDRATETLWDQIVAEGIVGPMTGEELKLVPVTMTRWSRWREAHPDTLVLSTDTGFEEDYSADHYGKYRDSDNLMFPVSKEDDRIHPKSVVFGFNIDGSAAAYTEALLQEHGTYSHEFAGATNAVTLHADGTVTLQRDGVIHEPIRLYWFAWYTFNPQTELVK
jgi:uncharacterized protein DUF3179